MQKFSGWAKRLARADIVFYTMPWLILLLVAGTVAQKYMGLYAAHKMFFASFVFWIGPVPLPGGYLLMGVITLCLALKFFLYSTWSRAKTGINLSHLGVLVLLAGGLLTAVFAREGYMVIPEGQQSPYVYDYVHRAMLVSSGEETRTIAFEDLKKGAQAQLPFAVKILDSCANCVIERRAESAQGFGEKTLRGFAQHMALKAQMPALDPEENLSGLTFEVSGAGEAQDGIYIAFEGMPKPIEITQGGKTYRVILGRAQRALPFALRLESFEKQDYPGTDKAREFISDLTVLDGGVEWPARIAMNEPLRYKGYTIYQSSFELSEAGAVTILSVVENKGRLFPYIGTLIVAAGLILHLLTVLRRRM